MVPAYTEPPRLRDQGDGREQGAQMTRACTGTRAARADSWRRATWLAGLAAALALAWVAGRGWIDPRFDMRVDDGIHHLLRQYVFDHLLRSGAPYPRWWPDLAYAYGYPLLNYYSPGMYYAGEVPRLLGASIYAAVQWVGFAAVLLGASGAYVLGWLLFRQRLAALVLAGAYVLSPYPFLTNLYLRTAVPEALGQGLLPWVLAGGIAAVRGRSWAASLWLAAPLTLAVLCHSLTALVAAGFLVPWLLAAALDEGAAHAAPVPRPRWNPQARPLWTLGWRLWTRSRPATRGLQRAAAGIGLALLLSAFFWVPLAAERGYVHEELGAIGNLSPLTWLFDPLRPRENPVASASPEPYLLTVGAPIDLHWVYPHSGAGLPGPAKPSLAQAVFIVGALLAVAAGWLNLRHVRVVPYRAGGISCCALPRALVALAAVLLPVLWLLNVTWSALIWKTVPLLPVIQFPWRLWGVFSLLLACVGAAGFAWLAQRGQQQWVLAAVLVFFVALNALGGLGAAGRFARDLEMHQGAWWAVLRGDEAEGIGSGTTTGGEFMPRSVILDDPPDPARGGKPAYERAFPEAGWVAGRVWPYGGEVQIQQVWDTPTWTEAKVAVAEAPAQVAFRTLVFPGWRAFLDGKPAPLATAPYDPAVQLGHGFAIVAVPPGEHIVRLAFGPTVARLLGGALSIVGAGACVLLVVVTALGSPRGLPRGWMRRALIPVIVLTAGAALMAYLGLGWRMTAHPVGRATSTPALIVLDLADAAAGGGASIASPDGATLGSFVDVRYETIHGQDRRWLYMHPASEVSVRLNVPPRAIFQAGLGVDPAGWSEPDADGARFLLEVMDAQGATAVLLDQVVQPQTNEADQGWRFAQVSLAQFEGQTVTLRLRTEARDTPYFDWAGWADPVVYVDRSARYPPPSGVAPAMLQRLGA